MGVTEEPGSVVIECLFVTVISSEMLEYGIVMFKLCVCVCRTQAFISV